MMRWIAVALTLIAGPVSACGEQTDCVVGDRIYRIAGAENASNGALVFAHGYRGSANGVMRNSELKRLADDLGVALIGLHGVNGAWQLPGRPRSRDNTGEAEFSYAEDVLADAASRFGLRRDRVVATGFSAGGMMTWNLACHRSELFAGFIPMSGTFWDPVPANCESPVTNVVHIHGTADGTVPLTGRVIADSKQGDVGQALAMYASYGGFGPVKAETHDDLQCDLLLNDAGNTLTFCRFDGGHSFRLKDLRVGWDTLVAAGQIPD